MSNKYICIDLKSFFASVECVERGLDPMKANLVVADPDRSDKTICLAVSPAMKKLGVKNRCRVFEIPKNIEYIIAPPRMKKYIEYSSEIYGIYLKYISKDDIHVYSIDEAFMDVTKYLGLYKKTARELAKTIMEDIYNTLGIQATAGIGTNLYLTKIALDILAKHAEDFIGELDEESYKRKLWNHKPLTDFWRIGKGTERTLNRYGIYTMEGITRMPEEFLYSVFGIDAELLIDHAWGRELTTIADIKAYKPKSNSLTSGQVLMRDYAFDEALIVAKEMIDLLSTDMVRKRVVTKSLTLVVGYSNRLKLDPAKGSVTLPSETNSSKILIKAISDLFRKITNPEFEIRRMYITCNKIIEDKYSQLSFFEDIVQKEKEQNLQRAIIWIRDKYGKNALLKGMDFEKGATTIERNSQIGGHKSGEQTKTADADIRTS